MKISLLQRLILIGGGAVFFLVSWELLKEWPQYSEDNPVHVFGYFLTIGFVTISLFFASHNLGSNK